MFKAPGRCYYYRNVHVIILYAIDGRLGRNEGQNCRGDGNWLALISIVLFFFFFLQYVNRRSVFTQIPTLPLAEARSHYNSI
jgi:hypothetical protein